MLKEVIDIINNLDFNREISKRLKTSFYQELLTFWNQERLYEKGVDIKGKELKTYAAHTPHVYADSTIIIKEDKGQKTSNVTAHDKGKLYDSFALKVHKTFAEMTASKVGLRKLAVNLDIDLLLGLTNKDKEVLSNMLITDIIKNLEVKISKYV